MLNGILIIAPNALVFGSMLENWNSYWNPWLWMKQG
jgi:hypothetical protein